MSAGAGDVQQRKAFFAAEAATCETGLAGWLEAAPNLSKQERDAYEVGHYDGYRHGYQEADRAGAAAVKAEHERCQVALDIMATAREQAVAAAEADYAAAIKQQVPLEIEAAVAQARADERERGLYLAELAWGIIANAGGGDWDRETAEWREAAVWWRDKYHAALDADQLAADGVQSTADEVK